MEEGEVPPWNADDVERSTETLTEVKDFLEKQGFKLDSDEKEESSVVNSDVSTTTVPEIEVEDSSDEQDVQKDIKSVEEVFKVQI